jgi:hypothetical protein
MYLQPLPGRTDRSDRALRQSVIKVSGQVLSYQHTVVPAIALNREDAGETGGKTACRHVDLLLGM